MCKEVITFVIKSSGTRHYGQYIQLEAVATKMIYKGIAIYTFFAHLLKIKLWYSISVFRNNSFTLNSEIENIITIPTETLPKSNKTTGPF